jgi:hypothetical protein
VKVDDIDDYTHGTKKDAINHGENIVESLYNYPPEDIKIHIKKEIPSIEWMESEISEIERHMKNCQQTLKFFKKTLMKLNLK